MKNTTHRVVILNNVNSELISQAILILKDSASPSDCNIMAEAERIVAGYMNRSAASVRPQKKNMRLTGILSAGVILVGAALFLAAKFA